MPNAAMIWGVALGRISRTGVTHRGFRVQGFGFRD